MFDFDQPPPIRHDPNDSTARRQEREVRGEQIRAAFEAVAAKDDNGYPPTVSAGGAAARILNNIFAPLPCRHNRPPVSAMLANEMAEQPLEQRVQRLPSRVCNNAHEFGSATPRLEYDEETGEERLYDPGAHTVQRFNEVHRALEEAVALGEAEHLQVAPLDFQALVPGYRPHCDLFLTPAQTVMKVVETRLGGAPFDQVSYYAWDGGKRFYDAYPDARRDLETLLAQPRTITALPVQPYQLTPADAARAEAADRVWRAENDARDAAAWQHQQPAPDDQHRGLDDQRPAPDFPDFGI